uniref:phytol kinase n=1 Tax=Chenopodium quinoa TaxID=63459 RepID=A0A803MIR2_CHEQI
MAIHLKLNTHYHCSRSFGTAQPCPSYSNLTFFHFHRHHYPFSETTLKHNSAASTVVSRRALLSSDAALFQDVGATAFLVTGGYSVVSNLSRKLVHIISGLPFVAAWPLFSASPEARYFASLAPFINGLRLVVNGHSLATDEGLLKSVTREGKPDFGFFHAKVSLLTVEATGIADIMGRKFGYVKLPYNQKKSWAGSISMFTFGFLISMGMLYYFSVLGYFQFDWNLTAQRVAVVSFVATVVESLPTAEQIDDNISVPLATLFTAYLCM